MSTRNGWKYIENGDRNHLLLKWKSILALQHISRQSNIIARIKQAINPCYI